MPSPAVTALHILLLVIVLYVTEIIPLAVTAVGGALLLVWFQATNFATAFSGFASDSTWLVVGMVMVGAALFETGLADTMGRAIVKTIGTSETKLILIVYPVAMLMSAFLSNSAATTTFMPIIQAISAASYGKVSSKRLLMPLAWAASSGGMLTLVGSTPPVIINALMERTEGITPFGFFEFGYIGLPVCIVLVIYCLTIGKSMTRSMWKEEIVSDVVVESNTYSRRKMVTAGLILVLCIVGFILQGTVMGDYFTLGTVSTTGAMLTVICGCLSLKRLYELTDWNTFFVLAGAIGFAAGLDECGAGQLIADKTVAGFGESSSFIVYAIFVGISIIMTQIMSNTACTAMMAPIGIFIAQGMGFSPLPLFMGIANGCAAAYMTPIGTAPNTIVLSAGNYSFMDYVKLGTSFQIAASIVIIAGCPLIWPL